MIIMVEDENKEDNPGVVITTTTTPEMEGEGEPAGAAITMIISIAVHLLQHQDHPGIHIIMIGILTTEVIRIFMK